MNRGSGYTSLMFVLLLAFGNHPLYAQQTVRTSLVKADSLPPSVTVDSMVAVSPPQTKSTLLAVGLSAVLPGAGQAYTERYWKIPLIWGFGVYFARVWNRADNLYEDAGNRYRVLLAQNAGDTDEAARAKYERDFYHDERDRFAFYLALTYVLNLVDAYVGASLYDFDVSDDLGGNANIRFTIPLR